MKCQTLLFAALIAATPVLFAQEEKGEKKKPAGDEQKMPDPRHKEHDALKTLAGDWECSMKMEAMPGVPGMEKAMESKGTEHAELVCNGIWLKSVITANYKGEPFQGVCIKGYDPFRKKYLSAFVCSDEQEGGACVMDGNYDEKTKTWTWTGKTPHGDMRSTQVFKDADNTVETCFMKSPEGKETKVMEATRKRARSAATPIDASAKLTKSLPKEQAVLQKDVGEWEATVKATHPGAPAATEDKATERVTAVCNGRWLWSDFKGEIMGGPFEGHALYGYDPNEKKYVNFWIDSMTPTLMKTSGSHDAATKTCSLEGTSTDANGKPVTVKEVITCKDDDTRVLQMEFKGADGVSNMEITYKRK